MLSQYPLSSSPVASLPPIANNISASGAIGLVSSGSILTETRSLSATVVLSVSSTAAMIIGLGMSGRSRLTVTSSGTAVTANLFSGTGRILLTSSGTATRGRIVSATGTVSVTSTGYLKSPNALHGVNKLHLNSVGSMQAVNLFRGVSVISLISSGVVTSPNMLHGHVLIALTSSGNIIPFVEVSTTSGETTAYLVNLASGGHSTYTNFTFNSFFRLGSDYYGCNDTGVYKLDGTTDAGTEITWSITTPVTSFGVRNRKYIHDARVIMRADADVLLTEIVDEQVSVSELTAPSDDRNGIHARRIKLPKGMRGTEWQFVLSGTGTIADIASLEVTPIMSMRT